MCTSTIQSFAAAPDTGFSEVSANAWHAEPVNYVNDNGIMSGTTNTTFEPNTSMSRKCSLWCFTAVS
ncbi:MAG: S-layer homology domain-containing protein [Clostridiales bacterium]|nr:S-layer homology domain-containing protein [Clostridiales bacterium]